MGEIQETIHIRAPIDRVFAALTDPGRGPEWNPAITGMQGVSPGPAHVGTQWNQTTLIGGRPMNLVCRITQLDPPRFGVLEVSGDQRGKITTHCFEVEDGTQVTQKLEYVPPGGLFGGLAGGFISHALRREMMRTMDRQRTIIEQECAAQRGSRTS
jgi:uncharacterized protein YndB with AHSA1/START domain